MMKHRRRHVVKCSHNRQDLDSSSSDSEFIYEQSWPSKTLKNRKQNRSNACLILTSFPTTNNMTIKTIITLSLRILYSLFQLAKLLSLLFIRNLFSSDWILRSLNSVLSTLLNSGAVFEEQQQILNETTTGNLLDISQQATTTLLSSFGFQLPSSSSLTPRQSECQCESCLNQTRRRISSSSSDSSRFHHQQLSPQHRGSQQQLQTYGHHQDVASHHPHHHRYVRHVPLQQPPPPLSILNVIIKPVFQLFLDWTHLTTALNLTTKMRQRIRNAFRWCPTSSQELDEAESKVLSYFKCNYKTYYVDIGSRWDLDHVRIWTMEIEPDPILDDDPQTDKDKLQSTKLQHQQKPDLLYHELTPPPPPKSPPQQGLPLVMVHGFCAGIGLWALNMEELAKRGYRKIYAFDLLGFGKSSRPKFPSPRFNKDLTELQRYKAEAEQMEGYFVESIEKWRQAIGGPLNDKFILMGHSLGAYLSLAYALRHPSHVAHVILADAWGIPPESQSNYIANAGHINHKQLPWWAKLMGKLFLDVFNPLSLLRAFGPWGPGVIQTARSDIRRKFERLTNIDGYPSRLSAEEMAEHPPPLDGSDSEDDDLTDDDVSEGQPTSPTNAAQQQQQVPGGIVAHKPKHHHHHHNQNDKCDFIDYIYHCNAQSRPSGEVGFKRLCTTTGWARLPMLERIHDLHSSIALTFIYGSRSWIDRQSGLQAKYILATKPHVVGSVRRPALGLNKPLNNNNNNFSDDDLSDCDYDDDDDLEFDVERVDVHVIQGAGHHVYADKPEEFNQLILATCDQLDMEILGIRRRQLQDDRFQPITEVSGSDGSPEGPTVPEPREEPNNKRERKQGKFMSRPMRLNLKD